MNAFHAPIVVTVAMAALECVAYCVYSNHMTNTSATKLVQSSSVRNIAITNVTVDVLLPVFIHLVLSLSRLALSGMFRCEYWQSDIDHTNSCQTCLCLLEILIKSRVRLTVRDVWHEQHTTGTLPVTQSYSPGGDPASPHAHAP